MPDLVDAYLLKKYGQVAQQHVNRDDGDAMVGVEDASHSAEDGDGSYFEVIAISTFGTSFGLMSRRASVLTIAYSKRDA